MRRRRAVSRRSDTSTPVELSPESIVRLIIRQARADSRLPRTRAPRFSDVPSAAASRTAVSGVRSTFTKPLTPSRVNRCDVASTPR